MKKMIIIILIALIITGVACIALNIKDNKKISSNGDNIIENVKESDIKSIAESFEANIIDNDDHYTLSILTNKVKDDLTITYNFKVFALDNTISILQNATYSDDENTRTVIIKKDDLLSNHLYEFNFVKLTNDKMRFNKNITIK